MADRWWRSPHPALREAYFQAFAGALETGEPHPVLGAADGLSHPDFQELGAGAALEEAHERLRDRELPGRVRAGLLMALDEVGRGIEGASVTPDTLRPPSREALRGWGPEPRLRLETDRGPVVLRLAPGEAPVTVDALLHLAEEGRFDGVPFHRVVPNFVAQGGDVGTGDGMGGPGFRVRTEVTRIPFIRGVVGMASMGRDTEGSQFYIAHSMQPHLEDGYTAFGWVEEGMEVVDRLVEGDRIVEARPLPSP